MENLIGIVAFFLIIGVVAYVQELIRSWHYSYWFGDNDE